MIGSSIALSTSYYYPPSLSLQATITLPQSLYKILVPSLNLFTSYYDPPSLSLQAMPALRPLK